MLKLSVLSMQWLKRMTFYGGFVDFYGVQLSSWQKKKKKRIKKGSIAARAARLLGKGMREALATLCLGMHRQCISPRSPSERRCAVIEGGDPQEEEIQRAIVREAEGAVVFCAVQDG